MLSGLDSLEPVEFLGVDVECLGVPSSESLSDPCVVESLSVAEPEVADPSADHCAESDSRECEGDAGVEGGRVEAGALGEVPVAEGGAGEGREQEVGAAEDVEARRQVEGVHVEQVRVVLDQLKGADAQGQLVVGLGDGVGVRWQGRGGVAIVTHIYYCF